MQGAQAIAFCFLNHLCRWLSCGCLFVCLFTALYYCTASAQQDWLDLFVPPTSSRQSTLDILPLSSKSVGFCQLVDVMSI